MKRILVVKLRPLGDMILAGPCFEVIRKAFPKAWVTALVQPPAQELLRASGWANEVFAYHKATLDRLPFWARFWKHARLGRALRKRKFDLAVDFSASHRSAQILGWSRPGMKAGLGLPALKGDYDLAAKGDDELQASAPELDRRVLGLLGIEAEGYDRPGGTWPVPAEATAFAEQFWKANGFKEGDRVVAVNPFASCRTKEWYPEKWAAVLRELAREGIRLFFTCAPLEKKGLEPIEKALGRTLPLYAGPKLVPLMGLYRKATAVLSVDSGPRHLAAGVGTPTLTVWGPEPVHRWHPYPLERHPIVIREIPCRPCCLSVCVEKKHEFMVSLEPQEVIRALKKIIP